MIDFPVGKDKKGRPIVMLVAAHLNPKTLDLDSFLLYIIHLLDNLVNNEYSVVYVHSGASSANKLIIQLNAHSLPFTDLLSAGSKNAGKFWINAIERT